MSPALDEILGATALVTGLAFLMAFLGVEYRLLAWKNPTCPSCGRSRRHGCRCSGR